MSQYTIVYKYGKYMYTMIYKYGKPHAHDFSERF